MRLIYVDEAGTSPKEPVRVVASVIVDGDNELRPLIENLEAIFDECVPQVYRDGFYFHCIDLLGSKYRNDQQWPLNDRVSFIKRVLNLVFVAEIPVALGAVLKENVETACRQADDSKRKKSISDLNLQHAIAFADCLEKSDLFLRKYLNNKEVGLVIAETHPASKMLGRAGTMYRDHPVTLSPEEQTPNAVQLALGVSPNLYVRQIKNIVDVPLFVGKSEAPILQVADACAYAFRRYLGRYPLGEDFMLAMLGPHEGTAFLNDPIWRETPSSGIFNAMKYKYS